MIYTLTLHPCIDFRLEMNDNPAPGRLVRTETVHTRKAGGKGINVSRALAALDLASVCLTVSGGDEKESFEKLLKGEDFETVFFKSENVRTNFEFVMPQGNAEINETVTVPKDTVKDILAYLETHLKENDLFIFSGSLPLGLTSEDAFSIITKAKQAGAVVFADTSSDALVASVQAGADYIKPNEAELVELIHKLMPVYPMNRGILDSLDSSEKLLLLMDGAEELTHCFGVSVICTLGENGSFFVNEEASVYTPAFEVEKTYCIKGAGDTYLAAFIYALAKERQPMIECLRMAASAASAYISTGTIESKDQLFLRYFRELQEPQDS